MALIALSLNLTQSKNNLMTWDVAKNIHLRTAF